MNLKNIAVAMTMFLVILNSSVIAVEQSGVAEDWGVQPSVGGDERINQANESAQNVSFSGGQGQTLFSLFAGGGRLVNGVFSIMFAGPTMFQNAGVPDWATAVFFSPLYFAFFGLIIYTITGRLL